MAANPDDQLQTMLANLPARTGHTIEEWGHILIGREDQRFGEIVKFLKLEHGVTHGYANLITHSFLEGGKAPEATGGEALIEAQFPTPKAHLRPIYDAVITRVLALGSDVEIAPKKTYVSLRRAKQFGLVQVSTRTRVDLGLNLPESAASGRLEESGSFNSMVSHRIRLAEVADVDEVVSQWLTKAYKRAD